MRDENLLRIELGLDPQTRWSLLPPRLPGKIEGPNPNYGPGAMICPLVTLFYPNRHSEIDTVASREGGNLAPGTLVEFSLKTRRRKGSGLLIEAVDLSPISADRERELRLIYEDRILDELAKRLGGQLPELQWRLSELESQIETEVGKRIKARTKELRQSERELRVEREKLKLQEEHIVTENSKLATERTELQELWERWEKERPAAQRYYEWILSQQQHRAEPLVVPERLDPDMQPPENWTEQAYDRLKERGFVVDKDTLYQFLAAMLSAIAYGDLVVLAGPSGVGKTSIIEQIAPMTGSGSAIVPVRPAWTDSTDLFGFFNPVHRIYQPTPFVDHLLTATQYEEANRLYMICLDEVNLARIENYAADLLVTMEKSRSGDRKITLYTPAIAHCLDSEYVELARMADRWTPEQTVRMTLLEGTKTYPPELVLPSNLVVLGTVNVDETTYMLSPKVLDRAFVIQFPVADWSTFDEKSNRSHNEKLIPIPVSWVYRLAGMNVPADVALEQKALWKTLGTWQDKYLRPLGVDCGYRLATCFSRLMKIGYHGLSLEPEQVMNIFIKMKILPRLAFTREEIAVGQPDRKKKDVYGQWCKDKDLATFSDLADVLKQIDEHSPGPVLQFWL